MKTDWYNGIEVSHVWEVNKLLFPRRDENRSMRFIVRGSLPRTIKRIKLFPAPRGMFWFNFIKNITYGCRSSLAHAISNCVSVISMLFIVVVTSKYALLTGRLIVKTDVQKQSKISYNTYIIQQNRLPLEKYI